MTQGTLTPEHAAHLAESGIDPDVIEARGYLSVTSKEHIAQLEPRLKPAQRRVPGLLIPAYRAGESKPYAYVLRPDNPRTRDGKPVKYEWPAGVAPCLDVLPRYRPMLASPDTPLLITEGAKKADAAASIGYAAVNLNGVYGWRGRSKAGGPAALADWEHVALAGGRRVILAFDSDAQVNQQVRQALNRLAHFLASKGAEVMLLALPTAQDGQKTGLDDWLVSLPEGDRLRLFEAALRPYEAVGGITKAGKHPQTGEELYHPAGYQLTGDKLTYTDPRTGHVTTVYPGLIAVTALGHDLDSDKETATVRFKSRGETRSVPLARDEIAQSRALITALASKGASVHEHNARRLSAYLIEYAALNDEALPYSPHTARLGLINGGLVTPAGSVHTPAQYVGEHALPEGGDAEAYPAALRQVLEWEKAGAVMWPLWLTLGASLAAPFIAKLRPRRSPVIYLSGPSGSGKTTAGMFATGAWGDPTGRPFKIETPRTTTVGFRQALAGLAGLPVLVDEAHAHSNPAEIESLVYGFANGQSYTKGSVDGTARGGETLSGVVLLAGEAVAEFMHAGAHRRVLYLPADSLPPLGSDPRSDTGAERARILEEAWHAGPGLLGPRLAERILSNWPAFRDTVAQLEAAYRTAPAKDPDQPENDPPARLHEWALALAVITATLGELYALLGLEAPASVENLHAHVAEALAASEARVSPAQRAYEAVQALIAGATSTHDDPDVFRLSGEIVAWRKHGEPGAWYVPTQSRPFLERVGGKAVQMYGREWKAAGLIDAGEGSSTRTVRAPGSGTTTRVLKVTPPTEEEDA